MAILRTVDVGRILPNPWRDGRGSATWASLADTYPINPDKAARLRASMIAGGVFEGVIAREDPEGYTLAFGHHRVTVFQALVKDGAIPDGFPLIVKTLTDAELLSYMARENAEEDGHSFELAVMNPVEAHVRAYAAGVIDLPAPDPKTSENQIRHAPVFAPASGSSVGPAYTADTLAAFLGFSPRKIGDALRALATLEAGLMTREALAGPRAAVELATKVAAIKHQAVLSEVDVKIKTHERAATRAEATGDKVRAKAEQATATKLEETRDEAAVREARAAADDVGQRVRDGDSVKAIRDDLIALVPVAKPAPAGTTLESYTRTIAQVGREDSAGWLVAVQSKNMKGRKKLAGEMRNAAKRLVNRAREVEE